MLIGFKAGVKVDDLIRRTQRNCAFYREGLASECLLRGAAACWQTVEPPGSFGDMIVHQLTVPSSTSYHQLAALETLSAAHSPYMFTRIVNMLSNSSNYYPAFRLVGVAANLLAGRRFRENEPTKMEYRESTEEARFREEVRDWLHAHKPEDPRPRGPFAAQMAYDRAWQRTQYEGGWAGISWPEDYGGRGLSLSQQLIWCEEYALAHCPPVHDSCWLGLNHAGPTLIERGTEEQKAFHLPRILKGEAAWCQGFSEPGAGSDLASLRTRGVVDGEHLVVNGQKIWTTLAHLADYQELLVRTGTEESRHRGLTWVICDMHLPGVEVRPITALDGEYHTCEVFYDDVRIPLANVVAEIDSGWSVAMTTFKFERGSASFAAFCEIATWLEDIIDYARSHPMLPGGRPAIEREALAYRLAMARAQVQAARALMLNMVSAGERGIETGSEASLMRLTASELEQTVMRLAIDVMGPASLSRTVRHDWITAYFEAFAETIAGGTSEIQRNIIGERVLGLPRS